MAVNTSVIPSKGVVRTWIKCTLTRSIWRKPRDRKVETDWNGRMNNCIIVIIKTPLSLKPHLISCCIHKIHLMKLAEIRNQSLTDFRKPHNNLNTTVETLGFTLFQTLNHFTLKMTLKSLTKNCPFQDLPCPNN